MKSNALLGTLGALVPVERVRPLSVETDRPVSFSDTLGGRKAFMGRRGMRDWSVSIGVMNARRLASVIYQATYGREPLIWFPPGATAGNAFPPDLSNLLPDTHSGSEGGFVEVEAGLFLKSAMPNGSVVSFPYRRGSLENMPVVPGRPMTVSAWIRGRTRIAIIWRNQAGSGIRTDVSPLEDTPGLVRKHLTAFPPAGAVQATFQIFCSQIAGLSATFTDKLTPYNLGSGATRVVVHGLGDDMPWIDDQGPLSEIKFTVSEVG